VSSPFDCLVKVGIIKNDRRTFPTKLQRNRLQVRFRGSLKYFSACDYATREGDLVYAGMGRDGSTNCVTCQVDECIKSGHFLFNEKIRTIAVDDVDNTMRNTSFVENVRDEEGS
jgi:hypothetical protein